MPAQTPRGFPYPLPTDPVSAGASDIKALAEALDAYFPALHGRLYPAGAARTAPGAVPFAAGLLYRVTFTPAIATVLYDRGPFFGSVGSGIQITIPAEGDYEFSVLIDNITTPGNAGIGFVVNDAYADFVTSARVEISSDATDAGGILAIGQGHFTAGVPIQTQAWNTGGGTGRITMACRRLDADPAAATKPAPEPPADIPPGPLAPPPAPK